MPESLLILAGDTSGAVNTVALCRWQAAASARGESLEVLAETVTGCRRLHSERLIGTVDWILQQAELRLDDVNLLAMTEGPGSFTGLRIGAATWKGLALGKGLPLVAVPTLDAMSRWIPCPDGVVCTLLDARMGEVFGACYQFENGVRTQVVSPRACTVEDLWAAMPEGLKETSPLYCVGDGATLYWERILAAYPGACFPGLPVNMPRASAVAAEAVARWQAGVSTDAGMLNPVYLRKSQAEINQEAGLIPVHGA